MITDIKTEPPCAYVTTSSLPTHPNHLPNNPFQRLPVKEEITMMTEEEKAETEKNAMISSLFEEIRLEAAALLDNVDQHKPAQHQTVTMVANATKKLKKRKSELQIEMTCEEIEEVLGDDNTSNPNSNFNPKHPFGPSVSTFSDIPKSPPAKYSQHQRSPPQPQQTNGHAGFPMPAYIQQQANLHNMQNGMGGMMPNGVGIPRHPHPLLPHHTRLLQHQQSAPNLRLNAFEDVPPPNQLAPINTNRPFDPTLVEEFDMCVRAILMACNRVQCKNVYRTMTGEVSELYSRVVKNQIPKKAVKKITTGRSPCTSSQERSELERQFTSLADGLENRNSSPLYESIVNFLYKMRIAIPDNS